MDLRSLNIRAIHDGLVAKDFSCEELCSAYLDAITAKNEVINAYITVLDRDVVLERARAVDAKIAAGEEIGMLEGVPYGAKDLFCTAGVKTTAASKVLEDFVPSYNATVIDRLNESGAILLGKLNCDEFAMGGSGETSYFGVTKNPWDVERVAGGSSSGSAAAVSAGLCAFALGTDTGGSIRQPAAFCGVVGWKPSYGRVSRSGVIPMTSSSDTMGILSSCVEDSVLVQEVIAGVDGMDSTTKDVPVVKASDLRSDVKGMKIGIPQEYVENLSSEMKESFYKSVSELESLGAEIVSVSLPMTKYGLSVYYVICPCEVSANMERYDGIRYGLQANGVQNLDDQYLKTRDQGLGKEVKRRIMIGTYALSAGYFDAYYRQAQKVRTKIIADFDTAFADVDVLMTPVSPSPAFKIGEKFNDPVSMYLEDVFMVPASMAGLCGVVTPSDMVSDLPIGVQFLSPQFKEELAFGVASVFEKNRGEFTRKLD